MGLILSIDAGTTNIKAALVDENNQISGDVKSIKINIENDASGRAEHDPIKLKSALLDVCKQTIGNRGQEVEGLSLTSFQFGLVLLDKNHNPLTKISTFIDTTAQSHHPDFLKAIRNVDRIYEKTGCPPIFQYPINRLHHIATAYPGITDKTAHVLDSKSFLMHVLTGEYCTDYSTANSMGCLDISGCWDDELIKIAGLDRTQFPTVLNGFVDKVRLKPSLCKELGLKNDTAVSVGLYDGAALAASLTGFENNIAVGNFGTSGMFRVPTGSPIQDSKNGLIQSCLLKPGVFFTGSGINNCTISTNLLLDLLKLDLSYLIENELSAPGSNGLMTFPYFTGERDKIIGNIGTGIIFGLGINSTRADLAQSFLEGVAFSYLLIKKILDPDNRIVEFRLGGGGTNNKRWMQIMADVLNLPIRLTQNPEMGIVGAACLARHGKDNDLLDNSRQIMQDATLLNPIQSNADIYQEVADKYFNIRASLREPLLAYRGQSH